MKGWCEAALHVFIGYLLTYIRWIICYLTSPNLLINVRVL